MSTIILILAMVAAIAWPSIAAVVKSQRVRGYFDDLERLTLEARATAQQSGQTVSLVTDGDGSFQIQQASADDQSSEETVALSQVGTVPGVSVSTYRVNGDEVSGEEWAIQFYSDGTADSGGVLIEEAGETWAYYVEAKSGRGTVARGELPDVALEQWEAGDYVQR